MAQEIVTWCDLCLARETYEPGESLTIAIDGHAPRVLDICKHDRDVLLTDLVAALDEFGRRPNTPAKATTRPTTEGVRYGRKPASGERPYPCLWCPADYAAASGLMGHLTNKHGLPGNFRELLAGVPCPICGEAKTDLSAHVSRSHDANVLAAILNARDTIGDPFGAYAEVIGRADKWDGAP